ncbi:MAG: CRISPR-associated protein Cas4 [Clostridiales bacterium]|nr:CRISPR-associated protein Cas4 [Clostridiales bacterium]
MAYAEEDFLSLSGLQHYAYCPRQWALIHVEQQWNENIHTVAGDIMHKRVHDGSLSEKRGDTLIIRDMRISSAELGISGACDVVEFHQSEMGIPLHGRKGLWDVYPVEYKKGKPKAHQADELQLCAQAMCLESMLACAIPEGALFYGEPKRRTMVVFTDELRDDVKQMLEKMHEYMKRGYTPKVKANKGCKDCSLNNVCVPVLQCHSSVREYLQKAVKEMDQ